MTLQSKIRSLNSCNSFQLNFNSQSVTLDCKIDQGIIGDRHDQDRLDVERRVEKLLVHISIIFKNLFKFISII